MAACSRTALRPRWTVSMPCSARAPTLAALRSCARGNRPSVSRMCAGRRLARESFMRRRASSLVGGRFWLVSPTGFEPALPP